MLHKFIPSFLREIDHYFLVHHRLLWMTKIHYVAFYMLIINMLAWGFLTAHRFPYQIDPAVITFFGVILSLVPFGFWAFRQVTISIENNFGNLAPFVAQSKIGLYTLCISMFLSLPFTIQITTEYQIGRLMADEMFEKYNHGHNTMKIKNQVAEDFEAQTNVPSEYFYRVIEAKRSLHNLKKDPLIYASIWLACAFAPALILFGFGMADRKDFMISIVIFGLSNFVGSAFLSAMAFQFYDTEFGILLFLIFYTSIWAVSLNGMFHKRYARFTSVMTILTYFYTPVCFGILAFALTTKDSQLLNYIVFLAMGVAMLLIPIFQKLFTRIRSLPKD